MSPAEKSLVKLVPVPGASFLFRANDTVPLHFISPLFAAVISFKYAKLLRDVVSSCTSICL